jgi:hypothetical protein
MWLAAMLTEPGAEQMNFPSPLCVPSIVSLEFAH